MFTYTVKFSCNPRNLSPAACSTRTVRVDSYADLPAALAKARNFDGPLEDIIIVSMHLV